MSALHEISADYNGLKDLVEQEELTIEDVAETLDLTVGDFEEKSEALIMVKENMQVELEGINGLVERLGKRKKSIERRQQSLIEYLRDNMERTGITKISCDAFVITLAKGRDAVKIESEGIIPTEYLNVKVTSTPDKKEILKALKDGDEVDGCSLVKSKSSVRIK